MSPIVNRINDRLHPLVERLSDQQRVLREKGTDLLATLQERQEKLFDRGQRALNHFEETVLERVGELLGWADGRTNGRSEVLKRTADFVAERLAELREEPADSDDDEAFAATDDDAEAAGEVPRANGNPRNEPKVEKRVEKRVEKKAVVEPPFDNYDDLNVKKLAARFNDLSKDQLHQAHAYEEANKARKTVFEAIEKLLG